MGNGKLLIGQGYGDATVNNPAPAIQQFANIVNQQRQQRLANQQQLLEQAGKINPNGIRDADRNDYMDKHNEWMQSAIAANNSRPGSAEWQQAKLNEAQKYGELNSFIGQSKQEGQYQHQLIMDKLRDPHIFNDASQAAIIKSANAPMSSPDFIPSNQYGNFEREIDEDKLDRTKKEINQNILKSTQWGMPTNTPAVRGDEKGVYENYQRSADPQAVLNAHVLYNTYSDESKKDLQQRFPNIVGDTPNHTLVARTTQDLIDRGDLKLGDKGELQAGVNVTETPKPEFKADRVPDKFYAHYDYRLANPLPGASNTNAPTPLQGYADAMYHGDVKTGKAFAKLIPTNEFLPGQGADFNIDEDGQRTVTIPAKYDQKAKAALQAAAQRYEKSPEKTNGILGTSIGGNVVPYAQSKQYKIDMAKSGLQPKEAAQTYTLPNDQIGNNATLGEIASKNGVDISAINHMAGGKGGRGAIPGTTTNTPKQTTTYKTSAGKSYSHSDLLKAGYSEDQIKQALQMGNLKQ